MATKTNWNTNASGFIPRWNAIRDNLFRNNHGGVALLGEKTGIIWLITNVTDPTLIEAAREVVKQMRMSVSQFMWRLFSNLQSAPIPAHIGVLSLLVVLALPFGPATPDLEVNNGVPCDDVMGDPFCTISAAVGAALPDDTIIIYSGIYPEIVLIDKDLLLRGEDRTNTIIDGMSLGSVVTIITGAEVVLKGLTFTNGDDANGGGINNNGEVTLINSTISGNLAVNGGGIYNEDKVTLIESTLKDNIATEGGGIHNSANVTIIRSTVSGNTAMGNGGGILNGGFLEFINSTVSGNLVEVSGVPGGHGGGLYNLFGNVELTYSTISNNIAGQGGGILNFGGLVKLSNTIVATNPVGLDCAGEFVSLNNNLDSDDTCMLSEPNDIPGVPPFLGPLANNGGPTETHTLLAASPAIDAGNNMTCATPPVGSVDQRGQTRPVDGDEDGFAACDIGAFELQIMKFLPILMK